MRRGHRDHPANSNASAWKDPAVPDLAGALAEAASPAELAENRLHDQADMERAHLAAVVDSLDDAVIAVSDRGAIIAWNRAAELMYGYTAEEMIGRRLSAIVPTDRRPELRNQLRRVKRGLRIERFETVRKRKNGQMISVSLNILPMRDADGRVIGATLIAHDITERKRAQAEVERLSRQNALILESAGEGIYGLDTQGRTTFSNPAALRMIGRQVEELLGKYQHEILHHSRADGSPYPAAECPIYASMRDGSVHSVEGEVFWKKDGTSFPVRYVSTPIREADGAIVGAVVVFEDISERQRAEESLRLLMSAVEQVDESVLITDAEIDPPGPAIVYANPAFTRMTGYTLEEVIGKTPRLLQGPKTDRAVLDRLRDDLVHGRMFHGETINYRKDGGEFVLEWRIAPIRDPKGVITHFVALQRDVTARKRAEQERERLLETIDDERTRLRAVINQMPEAVVLADAGGRIVAFNRAAAALSSAEAGQVGQADSPIRFDVRKSSGEPATWEELPLARAITEREIVVGGEFTLRRADGRDVPIFASAAPVVDPAGELIGAVAVFQDISPLKQLERLREEWMSVIAHDLRQPVAVITGYASLLVKLVDLQAAPAPVKKSIDHILASAHQLNRMIEDLLDMSRIEAGRLRLEPQELDLPQLVRTVVERTRSITQGHPVEVEVVGAAPAIVADPGRLEQVLGNLLSNAVKYGYPETAIQVRVETRPSDLQVTVSNQGPGIAPEDLPKLFTRFQRAERAQAEKIPGLGLGLYIAQGIVQAHGGRVWAESTPGETTSFHFTLPLLQHSLVDTAKR